MIFVLNSLAIGGSETKIIKVANALASSDVSVRVAYLNPPETGLGKISLEVSVTHLHRRGKYSISSLHKLRQLIDNESRFVVAVNQYPLLYVVPAVKLAKRKNVRAVALLNTSEMTGKDAFFAQGYAVFLRRCEHIVFGSSAQRAHWVEKYKLPRQRSQVIYNGVDHEVFSPEKVADSGELLRRKLEIPPGTLVLGSIGRLAREKSFDLLISALGRLTAAKRDAHLVLVGIGGERKNLEKHALDEGVGDRISFLGLLEDVRSALAIMDVFVLPSSSVETFSNAALEAMAMGRAVVLSDIGGAAEMIENCESGMLFPPGDVDALTDILNQLYDQDEKRRVLGAAARERVVKTFGFDAMLAGYKSLLRE